MPEAGKVLLVVKYYMYMYVVTVPYKDILQYNLLSNEVIILLFNFDFHFAAKCSTCIFTI